MCLPFPFIGLSQRTFAQNVMRLDGNLDAHLANSLLLLVNLSLILFVLLVTLRPLLHARALACYRDSHCMIPLARQMRRLLYVIPVKVATDADDTRFPSLSMSL